MRHGNKVVRLGRGGTPYIRVPESIDPADACVASVKETICEAVEQEDRKARISELETELEVIERNDFDQIVKLKGKVDELEAELATLESDRDMLYSMLAIMHGDGGHYRDNHGTVVAVQDAIRKWHARSAKLTDLEAKLTPPPDDYPSWPDYLASKGVFIYSRRKGWIVINWEADNILEPHPTYPEAIKAAKREVGIDSE